VLVNDRRSYHDTPCVSARFLDLWRRATTFAELDTARKVPGVPCLAHQDLPGTGAARRPLASLTGELTAASTERSDAPTRPSVEDGAVLDVDVTPLVADRAACRQLVHLPSDAGSTGGQQARERLVGQFERVPETEA
jgi:hypothetical protein